MAVSIIDNRKVTLCGVCIEVDTTYFSLVPSGANDSCPCNCGVKLTWIGDSTSTRLEKVLTSVDVGLMNFGGAGLNLASVAWTATQGVNLYSPTRNYAIYQNGQLLALSAYTIVNGYLGMSALVSNFSTGDLLTLIGI